MRALRKRGKALGVVAALVSLTVYAAVAFADTTVADGDDLVPIQNNEMAFGNVNCGVETAAKKALIAVKRDGTASPGTNVFQEGTTATISVVGTTGDVSSATVPASPGNQISIPASWDTAANNTLTASIESSVKVNSSTEGAGSGSVTYRASGVNQSNNAINRDVTMSVTWTTGACTVADTTDPTITITTPQDEAVFLLGDSVLADFSCQDEVGGSGLKDPGGCVGTVDDGAAIDTSSVGAKTFTVDAEDNAGNTASQTNDYYVHWDFDGFFSPVDNDGVYNKAKAGSAIPVKFSLDGDQGLDIMADGYPKSQVITCDSTAELDGIEATVNAGGSSLSYDAVADQYVYVWKTDKSWANAPAGPCRQLVVTLDDGTSHRANFKFVK